jgi:hypothetical protein
MESLLTLSIGEYQSVAIALRVVVALTAMTAALLALATAIVWRNYRLPLILSAVGLGGAAWFENGVWEGWSDAFELAGTSYAVTGHLLADQDRIIAWSLGVPLLLFSYGLAQISWGKNHGLVVQLGIVTLLLALAAPLSTIAALALLVYAGLLLLVKIPSLGSGGRSGIVGTTRFAFGSVILGVLVTALGYLHLLPNLLTGNAANGILVYGAILRSLIDLFSLVIPGVLLLIGVLRLSKSQEVTAK